jgi:hypothetical protein
MEKEDMFLKRSKCSKNMVLMGTGVYKVRYDQPVDKDGDPTKVGEIKIDEIDARYVCADPNARYDKDINTIYHEARYTLDELRKEYPKKNIKSDEGFKDEVADDMLENESDRKDENKYINVVECWMKDDEDKYPNGRIVTVTEKQVLEDKPNNYECGFPFVIIPNLMVPDRMFGMSDLKNLEALFNEINKILRRISAIIRKTSNRVLLINGKYGLDPKLFTGKDAVIVTVDGVDNVSNAAKWLDPPPMPPMMMDMYNKLMELFDKVSGIWDVMQGNINLQSSGGPSGVSIDAANQAAQTRIRQTIRNYKMGMKILAEKLIYLINTTYPAEKTIRITGMDAEELVEIFEERMAGKYPGDDETRGWEDMDDVQRNELIEQEDIKVRQGRNKKVFVSFTGKNLDKYDEMDVEVDVSTMIPHHAIDNVQTAMEAVDMASKGVLPELLDAFMDIKKFPYKDKIIEALKAAQEREQQQQQQQAEAQMKIQQQQADIAARAQESQGALQEAQAIKTETDAALAGEEASAESVDADRGL